jgi:hypothetical protein
MAKRNISLGILYSTLYNLVGKLFTAKMERKARPNFRMEEISPYDHPKKKNYPLRIIKPFPDSDGLALMG